MQNKYKHWIDEDEEDGPMAVSAVKDTIESYIDAEPISSTTFSGGLLSPWEDQRRLQPRVAQFAMNVLNAPGMLPQLH